MKVCVIGGGPAGLSFSTTIKDLEVTLFEEHTPYKEPQHCTGLISWRAYSLLSSTGRVESLSVYSRVAIYSSNWSSVEFEFKKPIATLIDRRKYLESLSYKLESLGHRKVLGRVLKLKSDGTIFLKDKTFRADIVVLCEGATQFLARSLGLVSWDDWRNNSVIGLQRDYKVKGFIDPTTVLIVLSHDYSPNYYSWAIPYSDGEYLRVGVGGFRCPNLVDRLNFYVKSLERKMGLSLKPNSKPWGGIILTRGPALREHYGNIVRLGDAAFHVKPVSGGGLFTSKIFSTRLAESISRESNLEDAFKSYYSTTKSFRRSLILQTFIAKVFHNLEDQLRCEIISSLREELEDVEASKWIDYDFHERVLLALITKPSASLKVLKFLNSKNVLLRLFSVIPSLL